MQSLPAPTHTARETYLACISGITKNLDLKERLSAATVRIEECADRFEAAARDSNLHSLDALTFKPEDSGMGSELAITSDELRDEVYTAGMTGRVGGTKIYEELKHAAEFCPLCEVRLVRELDHYLPKTKFPALSVAPLNLVPICSDCNKDKGVISPVSADLQMLHPYFDKVDDVPWLRGEVVVGSPARVRFFVGSPAELNPTIAARLSYQFKTLKLGTLYSLHANTTMRGMTGILKDMLAKAGIQAVRDRLQGDADSWRASNLNAWQAVMYQTLADSPWYCAGGFSPS